MNRSQRKLIAEETLNIIDAGNYQSPDGESVDISEAIASAVKGTRLFRPDEFAYMGVRSGKFPTVIQVANETTFAGCRHLLNEGAKRICCLNFASAKSPGGGFLGGSQAQEEALARASALYACLLEVDDFYRVHRTSDNSLYTHHMIYSPNVPVFRDDTDALLARPWTTSIITSPAVNAGALLKNRPELADQIEPVMRERIERVLRLAANEKHTHLVLGAWGCGIFRNDPTTIAEFFKEHLVSDTFAGVFDVVRFSVLDHNEVTDTFNAFDEEFS